jgi:DNA-binding protein HU-beta
MGEFGKSFLGESARTDGDLLIISAFIEKGGGMTKAELVDKIAKDACITKKAAEQALASVESGVQDSLKKGKKVTLVGFGTFSVAKRAARNGRNPQTGAVIKIKACKVVRFRPGKTLKTVVNSGR